MFFLYKTLSDGTFRPIVPSIQPKPVARASTSGVSTRRSTSAPASKKAKIEAKIEAKETPTRPVLPRDPPGTKRASRRRVRSPTPVSSPESEGEGSDKDDSSERTGESIDSRDYRTICF